MLHDPADETHRKPRQFRNTPLQKYIRLASLFLTFCYAGALYIGYRRHIVPLLNDEEYRKSQLNEEQAVLEDYVNVPILRGTIDKLLEIQKSRSKAEAELKDTQADESKP